MQKWYNGGAAAEKQKSDTGAWRWGRSAGAKKALSKWTLLLPGSSSEAFHMQWRGALRAVLGIGSDAYQDARKQRVKVPPVANSHGIG